MERFPDWDKRLADYISPLLLDAHFVWGERDCAMFTADAINAMTGFDILAVFRGRYSTATGSARALRRYGEGSLQATFDARLPERQIGMARRGDVVMHDGAVGICMGSFALFMRMEGELGLERVERSLWTRAWGVGE